MTECVTTQPRPGLESIRNNPFNLDRFDLKSLAKQPAVLITNEPFSSPVGGIPIRQITPVSSGIRPYFENIPFLGGLIIWLVVIFDAFRLVIEMRRPGAAGIISMGERSGSIFCFLNSFKIFRGGPVLGYRALLPANTSGLRKELIGRTLRGLSLIAVWSRSQIENYRKAFDVPREKFIFMPYKTNHSQREWKPVQVGDYIFSGGNSERDYETLFEAVRGLEIPVIVSTTKKVCTSIAIPENVILVSAQEPFFSRLMAGARMVVLCLKKDIIRGTGEATFLNAMWQEKPVVVADNISAADYIEDGCEGFIVPAGCAGPLREKILAVWNDKELAIRMGQAGRNKAASLYTHDQFKARMQTLAVLVYSAS